MKPLANDGPEYYSQSRIKTYRRCPKAHEYRYVQGLTRRRSGPQLSRGVTLHELLDARALGKPIEPILKSYLKMYEELWDEEKEDYSSPDDLHSIYNRYCQKYQGEGLDYRQKSEIEVTASMGKRLFKGFIDKLPQDQMGRVWVCDHKSHKVIPDESARFSDIQTVLYFWAARENGEKVDGILWDYIRTKPPTVPELLKKGGLTRRKDLDSDYDTYLAAIKKHGLNPQDYQAELERCKSRVFFHRVYLPKPGEDLIREVVDDFFNTAIQIDRSLETGVAPRNMTRDCKSCSYYSICSLEVRGMDTDLVRKQMYIQRVG